MAGLERWTLVDRLEDAFLRVAAGEGSEGHVLVGDAGQGKTRLVQELYDRLAGYQAKPAFWPRQLVPSDALNPRKVISPVVETVPDGALPEWLWLALSCRREHDSASFANVLPDELFELGRLAPWLARVERHAIGGPSRRIVRVARDSWEEIFSDATNVIGVLSLFGIAPVLNIAATATAALKRAIERAGPALERTWGPINAERPDPAVDAAEQAADHLVGLSRALPIILVIDDLHDGDVVTGAFLRRALSHSDGRILVVATAWSQVLDDQTRSPAAAALFDKTVAERVLVVRVEPLGRADLQRLVRAVVPSIEHSALVALLDAYSKPHTLLGILGLPVVQRAIDAGIITSVELRPLIDAVPDSVSGVARAQWRGFRTDVRAALSGVAAGAPGRYWHTEAAVSILDRMDMARPRELLEVARSPYAWIRRVDEQVEGFIELVHHAVAHAAALEHWSEAEIMHARALWVRWYVDTRDGEGQIRRAVEDALRREHVELAVQGHLPRDTAAVRSALGSINSDLRVYRYRQAVATADRIRHWERDWSDLGREVERQRARALNAAGDAASAVAALTKLCESLDERYGKSHPEALQIRSQLAATLVDAGRSDDAIRAYQSILVDRSRAPGSHDDFIAQTRLQLATTVFASGRYADGISMYETLLEEHIERAGPEDADARATAHELGVACWHANRYERAEEVFRQLAAASSRAVGDTNASTLSARGWVGDILRDRGCLDEAIGISESVHEGWRRAFGIDYPRTIQARVSFGYVRALIGHDTDLAYLRSAIDDAARVLGSNDPRTLNARWRFARALRTAGDFDEAIDQMREVIVGESKVLGPDHPETLMSRHWLGTFYHEAGDLPAAIAELTATADLQARVLGVQHPSTLLSRHWLGTSLSTSGDSSRAIEELDAALVGRTWALGADHPFTLTSREWLGETLHKAGQTARAVQELTATVEARTRVLGADHPDSLASRRSLGQALRGAGEIRQALRELQEAADGQARLLGPDHVTTLNTRQWLGCVLEDSGELERAIEEFDATTAGRARVLGHHHPHTLLSRHSLGTTLQRAGEYKRAIAELEATVEGRTLVLGADDADTLLSRHWLGEALCGLGEDKRAAEQLSTTVDGQSRVIGADHPHTLTSRHWLGEALYRTGAWARADEEFAATVKGRMRTLGADHPHTLASRHWLGATSVKAGAWPRAIHELDAAVSGRSRALGADHPDTLASRVWLGLALHEAGQYLQAITELHAAVEGRARVLGVEHPDTLMARKLLGGTLHRAREFARAIDQLRLTVDGQTRLLGGCDAETLRSRHALGDSLSAAGDHRHAVEELLAAVDGQTQVLGPEHPETVGSQRCLARARERAQ